MVYSKIAAEFGTSEVTVKLQRRRAMQEMGAGTPRIRLRGASDYTKV